MRRSDFLKTLAVPFVVPFVTEEQPKKEQPKQYNPKAGDIAYFDGNGNYYPISTRYHEGMTATFVQPKSIF